MQSVQQTLVHEAVEEFHFFGGVVQNILNDIFQHFLCDFHVIVQIGKCHFGFNHPEFRRMSGCVGIFRTEGRPEGINIAERHCKGFRGKLTGYGKVGFLAEEILGIIYLAIGCTRQVIQIQCSDTEHFACTLTVGACDDRCVGINKALALEKFMDCHCNQAAHTEGCGEQVCSGTQICDFTQKFYGVAFFLQGIIGGGGAFHINLCCLYLEGLLCFGGFHQKTFYNQRRADILLGDFFIILQSFRFKNNLNIFEEGAVIQLDKAEILGDTHGANPAAQCDLFICIRRSVAVDRFYCCQIHDVTSFPEFSVHNTSIVAVSREKDNLFIGFIRKINPAFPLSPPSAPQFSQN